MTAADSIDVPGLSLSPRAKLEILFATLLALFLVALDQTIVGVALPRIVTDLHGDQLYTWAITIYLLTSTISGPVYGKLSDLFGPSLFARGGCHLLAGHRGRADRGVRGAVHEGSAAALHVRHA